MDEIDHLLSSLSDHLEAADAKSSSSDVDSRIEEGQSIADDIRQGDSGDEPMHSRIERVLELLEAVQDEGTGNEEADRHIDAAKRSAERVLDR